VPRAHRLVIRCAVLLAGFAVAHAICRAQLPPGPRQNQGGPGPRASPLVTGNPFVRVWRVEDYDAGAANTSIVQHPVSGCIYVGNSQGVLEFDGAQWQLIPLPKKGAAETLAVDRAGRVWVGASNEIARLEPNAAGALHAVTVVQDLPDDDFNYSGEAVVAPDGVWFGGLQHILRVGADDEVTTWQTGERFGTIWWMDGAIHTAVSDREVVRLEGGGRLITILGRNEVPMPAQRPNPLQVFAARDAGGGEWILLTALGPVRWRRDFPGWRPFPQAMPFFREAIGVGAMFRADGGMIFSMIRPGIAVLAPDGRLERIVDRMPAIFNSRMTRLAEDTEGGVWLPGRERIVRLDLRQRFSRHENAQALQGAPRQVLRAHGQLFVAHSEGVASYQDRGAFIPAVNLLRGADALVVVDDRLLAAAAGLVEVFDDLQTRTWSTLGLTTLAAGREPPLTLFAGDARGMWLFHPEGPGWRPDGRVQDLVGNVATIFDPGDGWVWSAGSDGRIWRADFRRGRRLDAPVKVYGNAEGVRPLPPGARVQLFALGDTLIATCAAWTLRYDPARDGFVPETRIAGLPNPAQIGAEAVGRNPDGSVWLRLGPPDRRILLVRPGQRDFPSEELPALLLREFEAVSLFDDAVERTLWIAGADFLVSAALDWHPGSVPPMPVPRVRRITTPEGEPLWHARAGEPAPLTLERRQTSLRFEYAAALFASDHRGRPLVQYRTRLEGLDHDWTPWSAEPRRDFTNLPYRDFNFRLQARDPGGRVSDETRVAFAIAPPWWLWRTAIAGYTLAGLAGLGGVVKLRTRALHRRAERLEVVIATRTAELAEKNAALLAQNTELARLRQLETEEKIAARLAEEKARLEVLRYQLNPHFLYNALNSVYGLVLTTPRAAAGMVLRLAEFCRATLTRHQDDRTTVGACFEQVGLYLAIEKVRWNDSLHIEIALDDAARETAIPPFLLQPLVENAIKYGGSTSPDDLRVRLAARIENETTLVLEVANTGQWVEPEVARARGNTGVGHSNLRQQLERAFPGRHAFSNRVADGWVIVQIQLRPAPALAN
jgi:hypothetical protein